MKKPNLALLVAGGLLLAGSLVVYGLRIGQCYQLQNLPSAPAALEAFNSACQFNLPVPRQFSTFLWLFVLGIVPFTAGWLLSRPRQRVRRSGILSMFLLVLLLDSLLVVIYSLLGYPAPGSAGSAAGWAALTMAGLGLIMYSSLLALWHWQRWGLSLFQGASIALAAFLLLGGGPPVLPAVILGSVLLLSLVLRSMRHHLV